MDLKTTNIQLDAQLKITLSYSATEGREAKILLIHGNSSSKNVFQFQMESPLFKNYRLIALDLPGHGESAHVQEALEDKSIYTLPFYAQVISKFIENIFEKPPIVVGHSLGGHIAIGASKYTPYSGLLIFQTPPLETSEDIPKAFASDPCISRLFTDDSTETEVKELLSLMTNQFSEKLFPDFVRTDPICRRNIGLSLNSESIFREVSTLKNLQCPLAIIDGKLDKIVVSDYIHALKFKNLWKNKLIAFDKCGHHPQLEESDKFNRLLGDFTKENYRS